jgi:hypothetical protein
MRKFCRVLAEIATFATMIGVAYFVATLFPHYEAPPATYRSYHP